MTRSSTSFGGYRTALLVLVGGGLCALFLGVLGKDGPSVERTPKPDPPSAQPDAGPQRLQGIEAVRVVARTVRTVRVQTRDESTAAAMARQYLDRVLPDAEPGRRALLIEALGDPDDDVRWVALTGAHRYGVVDARFAKILVMRARDDSEFVAKTARIALKGVRRADGGAVQLLQQNLRVAQGPLWAAIVHALVNIDPRHEYKALLLAALERESVDERRAAAYGLARIGLSPEEDPFEHADALEPMIRALGDPDSDVRMWIVQGLSRMEHEAAPAVDALVERLADPAAHVADWAKAALGEIGRAALPAVARVLGEGDRSRAAGAAFVLRRVGGPEAIATLKRGLEHEDPVIRVRSMLALQDLESSLEAATALYVRVLGGEDVMAIQLALEGLSRLGADAAPARDAVYRLREHEDELVRAKVRAILAAVDQREDGR